MFRLFAAGSHSQWMEAYYGSESGKFVETVVFTLGNPLIAKDIMKHTMEAGLNIPPKVLVQATPTGGTRILYDLPSSTFGPGSVNPELKGLLEGLDNKLEKMIRRVLSVGTKL